MNNQIDSTMSAEQDDQQNPSQAQERRQSPLIQGEYFSTPLPVYSSDSSDDDSYETDDETGVIPSSLAHLGRMSRVATKRSRRSSMGSILSQDYEYETDSDDSSPPSHPPQQVAESSGLQKEPQDPLGAASLHSYVSLDYETDSDASESLEEDQPNITSEALSSNLPPLQRDPSGQGLPPTREMFNSFLASHHSLESVDESYETDHSSDTPEPEPEPEHDDLPPSAQESKRTPQDPDANDPAKRRPSASESSSPIRRLQEELDMARDHMEKWKASSHNLQQELQQQKASEESTVQEDLSLRLKELESHKASSENTVQQLGNQVAELQHLLAMEKAEHEQTMMNQQQQQEKVDFPNYSKVAHSRDNSRDSIALTVLNALASSTDSEKVEALEQEIREARHVITRLDEERTKLDKTSRSTIQEMDEQMESLQSQNQELLESQNALRQKNESLDALVIRKEALLKQKDQEIASLKEVIRKKDAALESQAASLEEKMKQQQEPAVPDETKQEQETTGGEVISVPAAATPTPSVEEIQEGDSSNSLRVDGWVGGHSPEDEKPSKRRSYRIKEQPQSESTQQDTEQLEMAETQDENSLRVDGWVGGYSPKDQKQSKRRSYRIKEPEIDKDKASESTQQDTEQLEMTETQEGDSSNSLRVDGWVGGYSPKDQKSSKRRSYRIKEPEIDKDKASESTQQDTNSSSVELSSQQPSETETPIPVPTTTTSNDTRDTVKTSQEQLEYDLDKELDTLRTKVHEMMTETVLLTDLVDKKDASLKDAKRRLEMLQAENTKLKATTSAATTTKDKETDSSQPDSHKNDDHQQSSTAKELMIAALQAELEVEKLRREELEQKVKQDDEKDDDDDGDSSVSVSISDVESNLDDKDATAGVTAANTATAKAKPPSSVSKENKDTTPQDEGEESDSDSSVGAVGTRVFGQEEARLDEEQLHPKTTKGAKEPAKQQQQQQLKQQQQVARTTRAKTPQPSYSYNQHQDNHNKNNIDVMMMQQQYGEEISHLKHLIRKRDEGIGILRDKLMEQEALISLLNKTLSGKDTRIDRLERLIRIPPNTTTGHPHYSISKVLEENEMTMDSLVLYRFETQQEISTLQNKIRELEDQVRASKETEYQLRRRTDELSSAESQIRNLKAELKSQVSHASQLMEEHAHKLANLQEEKMRLEYAVNRQSQEFQLELGKKEDFIKVIHSEATEKGLLIDSLETSVHTTNRRLVQMESQISNQTSEITILAQQLNQRNHEQSLWIQEQQDKDELIQMLNESRLEGQRIIEELQQQHVVQQKETSRQKRLRRHYASSSNGKEQVSGLDAYMKPFVLDLNQAQIQYDTARKNLRLAHARERLIRPLVHGSGDDED